MPEIIFGVTISGLSCFGVAALSRCKAEQRLFALLGSLLFGFSFWLMVFGMVTQ